MKYLVLAEANSDAYNNFRYYDNIKDAIEQYKYYKKVVKAQPTRQTSRTIIKITLLDATNATELEVKE